MTTITNKTILIKRLKSLLWRVGMIAVAFGLGWLIENIGLFGMGDTLTVMIGLGLGEVSKEFNTRYDLERFFRPAKS